MSNSDTTKTGRIRVVAIDDHPAITDAIDEVVSSKMGLEFVGSASTAEKAFELVDRTKPDVAVVDIALGDAHGLDLVQNMLARHPDLQVVVYSMYDESIYAERAIRAGVSGYVMKSVPPSTVVEAIRTVARKEVYLSGRMSTRMLSKLARGNTTGPVYALDALTDREMAVFQLLGQGYGVEDIAEQLHLSRKTVETYRRRAKEKLDFDNVAQLLQYAVQWTYGQSSHGTDSLTKNEKS